MKAIITLNFVKEEYKNKQFEIIKTGENYIEIDVPKLGVARLYDGEYEPIK